MRNFTSGREDVELSLVVGDLLSSGIPQWLADGRVFNPRSSRSVAEEGRSPLSSWLYVVGLRFSVDLPETPTQVCFSLCSSQRSKRLICPRRKEAWWKAKRICYANAFRHESALVSATSIGSLLQDKINHLGRKVRNLGGFVRLAQSTRTPANRHQSYEKEPKKPCGRAVSSKQLMCALRGFS